MNQLQGQIYPKFLKKHPQVWGFDFYDLGIIALCLLVATIFSLPSWMALILCIIGIFITKILRRYIDFTVILLKKVDRWGEF